MDAHIYKKISQEEILKNREAIGDADPDNSEMQ
jgi:hypothetical protein